LTARTAHDSSDQFNLGMQDVGYSLALQVGISFAGDPTIREVQTTPPIKIVKQRKVSVLPPKPATMRQIVSDAVIYFHRRERGRLFGFCSKPIYHFIFCFRDFTKLYKPRSDSLWLLSNGGSFDNLSLGALCIQVWNRLM